MLPTWRAIKLPKGSPSQWISTGYEIGNASFVLESLQKTRGKHQGSSEEVISSVGGKPIHPSLHFKCINAEEDIWSVRISLDVRAIGVLEKEIVTWFWIGTHDEYERFFG